MYFPGIMPYLDVRVVGWKHLDSCFMFYTFTRKLEVVMDQWCFEKQFLKLSMSAIPLISYG